MRVASVGPSYCAACFGQKPEVPHIDFEAAYDGPVIEVGNGIKVTIDDLIICEQCLAVAVKLLGYDKEEELRAENKELGEALEKMDESNRTQGALILDLEASIKKLASDEIKRPAGRPKKPVTITANGS